MGFVRIVGSGFGELGRFGGFGSGRLYHLTLLRIVNYISTYGDLLLYTQYYNTVLIYMLLLEFVPTIDSHAHISVGSTLPSTLVRKSPRPPWNAPPLVGLVVEAGITGRE